MTKGRRFPTEGAKWRQWDMQAEWGRVFKLEKVKNIVSSGDQVKTRKNYLTS